MKKAGFLRDGSPSLAVAALSQAVAAKALIAARGKHRPVAHFFAAAPHAREEWRSPVETQSLGFGSFTTI